MPLVIGGAIDASMKARTASAAAIFLSDVSSVMPPSVYTYLKEYTRYGRHIIT